MKLFSGYFSDILMKFRENFEETSEKILISVILEKI